MEPAWPGGPPTAGPLAGTKVLDLSRVLAGPFAGMMLGDLGADVIKIEHPAGDETRRWGPPFVGSTAAYYLAANRNKRSVVLDLRTEADRAIAQQLAASADVILENFLPGATDRFGLSYADVSRMNPGCVYCSITSFGRDNPQAHRKGYDLLMQAIGGIMGITGPTDGPPVKVGVAISDLAAGMFSTIGVLAALTQRAVTGKGDHVEVALLDAQVALLANQAMNWLSAGVDPGRLGSDHPNVAPYGAFATKSSSIVVGAGTDQQFRELCVALWRQEWADDPRFSTNAARVENRAELRTSLEQILVTQDADHWVSLFDRAGVICGPIRSVREVFEDPFVEERMVQRVEHPTLGSLLQVASPVQIGGRRADVRLPPPDLGSDTDNVRRFFRQHVTGEG